VKPPRIYYLCLLVATTTAANWDAPALETVLKKSVVQQQVCPNIAPGHHQVQQLL